MTCDDLFDLLTSPGALHASTRSAMERHLETCAHCRALAASIAPAVDSLRAAAGPALELAPECKWDAAHVPSTAAMVSADSARLGRLGIPAPSGDASPIAAELSPAEFPRAQRTSAAWLQHCWLPAIAGMLLLAAALAYASRHGQQAKPAGMQDRQAAQWWVAMALPSACLKPTASLTEEASAGSRNPVSSLAPAPAVQSDLSCCTHCHQAGMRGRLSPAAVHLLAESCTRCHLP